MSMDTLVPPKNKINYIISYFSFFRMYISYSINKMNTLILNI